MLFRSLLETSMEAASRILFNITGSSDISLSEVDEAANIIANATGMEEADVIFGMVFDDSMGDKVRITVVATGFASDPLDDASRAFAAAAGMNEVTSPAPPVMAEPEAKEEEDLEDIPSFLRKK